MLWRLEEMESLFATHVHSRWHNILSSFYIDWQLCFEAAFQIPLVAKFLHYCYCKPPSCNSRLLCDAADSWIDSVFCQNTGGVARRAEGYTKPVNNLIESRRQRKVNYLPARQGRDDDLIDKPSKILLLFIVDRAFDNMFKSKRQKQIDINIMRVVNIHRKLELLLFYHFFLLCFMHRRRQGWWMVISGRARRSNDHRT